MGAWPLYSLFFISMPSVSQNVGTIDGLVIYILGPDVAVNLDKEKERETHARFSADNQVTLST